MELEQATHYELLLSTLTESMRAQREIISLLRELKLELAELRSASGDELVSTQLCDEWVDVSDGDESHDVQSTDPGTVAASCDDLTLPLLKTIVNIDGSPIYLEKVPPKHHHLAVVE